jgi:hypothetical protein
VISARRDDDAAVGAGDMSSPSAAIWGEPADRHFAGKSQTAHHDDKFHSWPPASSGKQPRPWATGAGLHGQIVRRRAARAVFIDILIKHKRFIGKRLVPPGTLCWSSLLIGPR